MNDKRKEAVEMLGADFGIAYVPLVTPDGDGIGFRLIGATEDDDGNLFGGSWAVENGREGLTKSEAQHEAKVIAAAKWGDSLSAEIAIDIEHLVADAMTDADSDVIGSPIHAVVVRDVMAKLDTRGYSRYAAEAAVWRCVAGESTLGTGHA